VKKKPTPLNIPVSLFTLFAAVVPSATILAIAAVLLLEVVVPPTAYALAVPIVLVAVVVVALVTIQGNKES
jgi:amino acid transporter